MITEILLYQITLVQEVPFLFLFRRKEKLHIRLHYRVEENRFWYSRWLGGRLLNEHPMKHNYEGSVRIMDEIVGRMRLLSTSPGINLEPEVFDLRETDPGLVELIDSVDRERPPLPGPAPKRKAQKDPPLRGLLIDDLGGK